jgi:hypothetical protein
MVAPHTFFVCGKLGSFFFQLIFHYRPYNKAHCYPNPRYEGLNQVAPESLLNS